MSTLGYKERNGTSQAAAESYKGRADVLRNICLAALAIKDATADEIADAVSESVLSVRPRMSELYRRKMIFKTRSRRKNASGMSAVVWSVNPPLI